MGKDLFSMLNREEGAGNSSTLDSSEELNFMLDNLLAQPAEHIPSGQYTLRKIQTIVTVMLCLMNRKIVVISWIHTLKYLQWNQKTSP